MDLMTELRTKAQDGIANRLFADAAATDASLRSLGSEIAKSCGATPLFGPIKDRGRANEKVQGECGGDWFDLRDAVRMTIIAPDLVALNRVQAEIRRRCRASNGLGILRDVETFGHSSPCGYSGLNFAIAMPNGRPAEIQANIPSVMFGQLSESLFGKLLGGASLAQLKSRFLVDGGLGHGLYEIYRVAPNTVKARQAALLSKSYFNYLRGVPNATLAKTLKLELTAFANANPMIFHH